MPNSPSKITEVKLQIEQIQGALAQAHRLLETVEHAEYTMQRAGKKARGGFRKLVILAVLGGGAAFAAKKYLGGGDDDTAPTA